MASIDVFVIGGGINGCAIACDAAGRDLKTVLCERGDLASGTSGASSKLIHGGLRYLEQYEFGLVRAALKEREILLHKAPLLIQPLKFTIPNKYKLRPSWLIKAGLKLYDYLYLNNSLPNSYWDKNNFYYYDAWADDSRLVIHNALHAQVNGAKIFTYSQCISIKKKSNYWEIILEDNKKQTHTFHSKILINATGPWVNQTAERYGLAQYPIKLIQGSHLIFPKLYAGNHAYLLQHQDGRVIFVLPYEDKFSLVGTTDLLLKKLPEEINITDSEKNYLCDLVNRYFDTKVTPSQVIDDYSGIRPLIDNNKNSAHKLSRDYQIKFSNIKTHNPLITILGGKITTHRLLAEQCIDKCSDYLLKPNSPWTAESKLFGFDIDQNYKQKLYATYPNLAQTLIDRLAENYGTQCELILKNTQGEAFGYELYQNEVDYLLDYEWAKNSSDILWRRTKLGLLFNSEQKEHLNNYIMQRSGDSPTPL